MKLENLKTLPLKSCGQVAIKKSKYEFKDGICLKDGNVYGKIVYSDNKLITIEVDNGNRYMKGQIIDFRIDPT